MQCDGSKVNREDTLSTSRYLSRKLFPKLHFPGLEWPNGQEIGWGLFTGCRVTSSNLPDADV